MQRAHLIGHSRSLAAMLVYHEFERTVRQLQIFGSFEWDTEACRDSPNIPRAVRSKFHLFCPILTPNGQELSESQEKTNMETAEIENQMNISNGTAVEIGSLVVGIVFAGSFSARHICAFHFRQNPIMCEDTHPALTWRHAREEFSLFNPTRFTFASFGVNIFVPLQLRTHAS